MSWGENLGDGHDDCENREKEVEEQHPHRHLPERIKSSSSTPLIYTEGRRNPAIYGANQEAQNDDSMIVKIAKER